MKRTASSRLRTTTSPFRVRGGSNLNSVIALSWLLSVPRLFAQEISRVQRTYSDHVMRRQWPSNPLQCELTDRLDRHGVLDCHQHPGADEDLSGLDLIAEPRSHV